MSYTFDWGVLWRPPYGQLVLDGVRLTIGIALVAWVNALVLGTLIGFGRALGSRLVELACSAYVEVLRNIPILVQMFFWYFAFPTFLPDAARKALYGMGWEMGSAIVALSLYTSARVAEHVRSGLRAATKDAGIAALATGLDWWQTQRYVVGPLVFRLITPALTSEFITVFKGSSLAMVVGVMESTYVSQEIGSQTFHYVEANSEVLMIYLTIAGVVTLFMGYLERRFAVVGLISRTAG